MAGHLCFIDILKIKQVRMITRTSKGKSVLQHTYEAAGGEV